MIITLSFYFKVILHIKSILISIPKDYYDTRESVRSKLMFLQDESELPDFDRIILAGDYSKTGDCGTILRNIFLLAKLNS